MVDTLSAAITSRTTAFSARLTACYGDPLSLWPIISFLLLLLASLYGCCSDAVGRSRLLRSHRSTPKDNAQAWVPNVCPQATECTGKCKEEQVGSTKLGRGESYAGVLPPRNWVTAVLRMAFDLYTFTEDSQRCEYFCSPALCIPKSPFFGLSFCFV